MLLPGALADLPSTSMAVKAYMGDTAGIQIPVLPKFYAETVRANGSMRGLLAPTDDSMLPVSLTSLLSKALVDHGSELTTTVGMCSYFDTVLPALHTYSDMQFVHKVYLSKPETGTSSCVLSAQTRPGAYLMARGCMLMGAQCMSQCHVQHRICLPCTRLHACSEVVSPCPALGRLQWARIRSTDNCTSPCIVSSRS